MSNSKKFNAETSLKMLEKAAEKMREYLASGNQALAADSEFYARAAHKNAVALKEATNTSPLAR